MLHPSERETSLQSLFFPLESAQPIYIGEYLLTLAGPLTGELTASAGKIKQHQELWETGTA